MKKIILAIAALCVLSLTVHAQSFPKYGVQTISVPASLVAGTTNYPLSSAPYIDTSSQNTVAFSSTIWGTASIGATNIYTFAPTLDGTYYATNASQLVVVSNLVSAGATTNTSIQSWNSSGARGYKLINIITVGTATNGTHQYGVKIQAP